MVIHSICSSCVPKYLRELQRREKPQDRAPIRDYSTYRPRNVGALEILWLRVREAMR